MIELKSTHDDEAIGNLLEQFKRSPKLKEFISIWVRQIQKLENAAFALLDVRDIDTTTGNGLDIIGSILNLLRAGADDEDYRTQLKAKILVDKSMGSVDDILGVVSVLEPSLNPELSFVGEAAFFLDIDQVDPSQINLLRLQDFVSRSTAAGVGIFILYHISSDPLVLDSGLGLDQGRLGGVLA